jgi:hypothetical protein
MPFRHGRLVRPFRDIRCKLGAIEPPAVGLVGGNLASYGLGQEEGADMKKRVRYDVVVVSRKAGGEPSASAYAAMLDLVLSVYRQKYQKEPERSRPKGGRTKRNGKQS